MSNFIHLNKDEVIKYYQKHTLNECAKEFNTCSETIKRKLMVWGVEVRTKKEALKIAFNGDSEKAIQWRKNKSKQQKQKYQKLGQKLFNPHFYKYSQKGYKKTKEHQKKIKESLKEGYKSGRLKPNEMCLSSKQDNKNGNWKGGRSNQWWRCKVLNRAKGKCEVCNWNELSEILEAHHIDHNRSNMNLDNGLAVCPLCHRKIHYWNLKNKKEIFNKLNRK